MFESDLTVIENYCTLLEAQDLRVVKNPNDYRLLPKDPETIYTVPAEGLLLEYLVCWETHYLIRQPGH